MQKAMLELYETNSHIENCSYVAMCKFSSFVGFTLLCFVL